MKRSILTRVVTALWGVWFVAALMGPATLHACPQHAALMHATHGGSHADMHKPGHTQSQQKGLDHKCNCLSDCCQAAVITSSSVKVPNATVRIVQESSTCSSGCDTSAARRDHAQPFPNGPPSAV